MLGMAMGDLNGFHGWMVVPPLLVNSRPPSRGRMDE